MAKTLWSHSRGPGFDPRSGTWIPHAAAKDLVCCCYDNLGTTK